MARTSLLRLSLVQKMAQSARVLSGRPPRKQTPRITRICNVTGFAVQPNARELIEKCDQVVGIPATYVQATPDLMMGDLLKNMRSSQVFSVCGMPDAELRRVKQQSKEEATKYEVELLGIDIFDPTTMEVLNREGDLKRQARLKFHKRRSVHLPGSRLPARITSG